MPLMTDRTSSTRSLSLSLPRARYDVGKSPCDYAETKAAPICAVFEAGIPGRALESASTVSNRWCELYAGFSFSSAIKGAIKEAVGDGRPGHHRWQGHRLKFVSIK